MNVRYSEAVVVEEDVLGVLSRRNVALLVIGLVLVVAASVVLAISLVGGSPTKIEEIPGVDLTSPDSHDVSKNGFMLGGKSRNIPDDQEIWVVTKGLYPGDTYQPENQPCPRDEAGDWTCPPIFVGGPDDRGRAYDVIVMAADKQAQEVFTHYDQTKPPNQYPGIKLLPPSTTELSRLRVTRID